MVDSSAPWRRRTYSHLEIIADLWNGIQKEPGKTLSPLFSAPFFSCKMITIDWLHTCELGVTQHFVGGAFDLYLDRLQGTLASKVRNLWASIQFYYRAHDIADRLQGLTRKMIRAGDFPKLRGSAACIRALVPFVPQLLGLIPRQEPPEVDIEVDTADWASQYLCKCYSGLGHNDGDAQAQLPDNARKFAIMMVSLEQLNPDRWRVYPKLHKMLHMVEQGQPSSRWVYKDEDFGGPVAGLARRRGGQLNPTTTSSSTLARFLLRQSPHQLVRGA